jgi:hypothetical protein
LTQNDLYESTDPPLSMSAMFRRFCVKDEPMDGCSCQPVRESE